MKYATAILVALASGCTANNPNYVGDVDGGFGSDFGGIRFDGGKHDGPGSPDLAGSACTDGQRRCATGASEICLSSMFQVDRMCPSMSMCHEGYCQPPPTSPTSQIGASCENMFSGSGPQENQCLLNLQDKLSCMPFFDPTAGGIVWRCDHEIGMGLPGTPCTMGAQCRSGFCGSNLTCFRACQSDQDCPQTQTQSTRCMTVSIVVEGMQVSAQSCIPN
jgi:hypothetical protein